MANILYLVHRLPYPPNKGDKVRSYHLLQHLARQHNVYLGTFVDDPDDWLHLPRLSELCADMHVAKLSPRLAKIQSLKGLLSGEPLSLPYYRNAALQQWVTETLAQKQIDAVVVFSSVMAQYLPDMQGLPVLVDFVDADSAKWSQYAETHAWPMSWIYRREGRKLFEYERQVARAARHSFFVTEAEAKLFTDQAPDCQPRVSAMANGVEADFFSPAHAFTSPYRSDEIPIVFTGAMDYWPNIDAVSWFAKDILPLLKRQHANLRFYIVGRSPAPEVLSLASEDVIVTGTVSDVRPYLHYAALVVAPLRIARGVQNKVLEAMSMAKAVVASAQCAGGINAIAGVEFEIATVAEDYVNSITILLKAPMLSQQMGLAARAKVVANYSWHAHLSCLDHWLPIATNAVDQDAH